MQVKSPVQDTEYKKQMITKLESELVRANEDLASYKKEIKARSINCRYAQMSPVRGRR